MKFKPFSYGTSGLVDIDAINRVVIVNKISITFGVTMLLIPPIICYYVHWQPSLTIPFAVEFVINASVLALNYYGFHRAAALTLFFLQVAAIIYFCSLLGKILDLEMTILLLIPLLYLILKDRWLRTVALLGIVVNLIVVEYARYFDGKQPTTALSYDEKFIVHILVLIAASVTIYIISRPYVKSNDNYNELQKAKHFITLFVAQVTHELRSPLDNIHHVSELLKKKIGAEERLQSIQSYVDISFIVSSHAKNIVNNVLSMSEIEMGKIPPPVEEAFVVAPFFEEIIAVHRLSAYMEGMSLRLELDMPEVIKGDRLGINQILYNLVANAIKYGEKGGVITVSVKRQGTTWELKVSNPGPGIPRNKLATIFDTFVRGKAGQVEGSGLGLYIVKSKVMQMKGKIDVESDPAVCTTFTVVLPLIEAAMPVVSSSVDPEPEAVDLSGMQVLVAEDNKLTTVLLRNYLKNMGCVCSIVPNGQELLEIVVQDRPGERPDIILLDGQMPVLNGEQTIRQLKLLPSLSDVPIIVMTGDIYSGTLDRMLAAGANAYLKKPIEYKSLERAIGACRKGD